MEDYEDELLLISAIDDVFIDELNYYDLFTEDERVDITNRLLEIVEKDSLLSFRERFGARARELYEEVKEGE